MTQGISVIICCYNSAGRLPETLYHLAKQKVGDDITVELVIVDNASSDNTVAIASEVWAGLGNVFPLSIVTENKRGVHNARITGIGAAAYECLIFCDDDNRLSEHYLANAFSVMSDGSIGVCGGWGQASFEDAEPSWFSRYEGVFGCGRQTTVEGVLDWRTVGLYSAGMAIRKSAIMQVLNSGYQPQFAARNDGSLSGGEDFELVVLIRALGYKAYYSDKMTFKHFMPRSRMTWEYLTRLVRGSTINTALAYVYADTLRYLYTKDQRYKVNWMKDIIKAIYGAFLMKITELRDVQIMFIRMTGSLRSVIRNASRYSKYKQQVERIYELSHKDD